jgi:signal transduction histidine kinase
MSKSKGNILLVDDIPANLQVLTQMLTEQGYKIRPTTSGQLALKSIQVTLPDLVLLDIQMPEMNGYEVCEKLKADDKTRDLPVIFISALSEVFDKVKAFSVGGVDYVTKPFQAEEVLARVETHLKIHQLQQQLMTKNEELQQTLEHLQTTQSKLVEAEKMASLGRLVAGVAHEINTPIGISMMSASHLASETETATHAYDNKQLKGSALKAYFETSTNSSQLILNNLKRANELIQNFKQIAVDQTYLEKRTFAIKPYLEESLIHLSPQLNKTQHIINVNGDDNLTINSYPGAFSQIITNLVINSLNHAYQNGEIGHINLNIRSESEQLIIEYQDDGCGIPTENLAKIFEPFFTTQRAQGGTGLGLHIVYNLVTQKLKGNISCTSNENIGTIFTILIPL